MPSPGSLVGRYERYKKGTGMLVEWLTTNASHCTDVSKLVASLSTLENQRQVKAGAVVEVRTSELLKLAQAIADAIPPIPIPIQILEVAQEVIRSRQESADIHAAHSLQKEEMLSDSDITHQYFIDVLVAIYAILEAARANAPPSPAPLPSKKKPKNNKKKAATDDTAANMFSSLTLGIPTEVNDSDDTAPKSSAKRVSLHKPKFKLKLEKQEDELLFALICHLQDTKDVCDFIKQTWLEYKEGRVTFLLASLATNIAFALMKCANNEFVGLHPSLASHDEVLVFLGLEVVEDIWNPFRPVISLANVTGTDGNPKKGVDPEVIRSLCVSGLLLRRRFEDGMTSMTSIMPKANVPAWIEKMAPPPDIVQRAGDLARAWSQFDHFAHMILENTVPLALFGRGSSLSRMDGFEAGLTDVNGRPLWLSAACECYMDIFSIMGPEISSTGVGQVEDRLAEWKDVEKFHQQFPHAHGPSKETKETFELLCSEIHKAERRLELNTNEFDRGDYSSPLLFKHQKRKAIAARSLFVSGLERSFPVNAGGTAYEIRVIVLKTASRAASVGSMIQSMAYLYKAARHLGLISVDWQDMDFFIAAQQNLIPKFKPSAHIREFMVAFEQTIGMPSSYQTARKGKIPKARQGAMLGCGATLAHNMLGTLAGVVGDEKYEDPSSVSKIIEILLHQMTAKEAALTQAGKVKTGKAAMERESFTPLELLTTFKKTFIHEEPLFYFDYLGLWNTCETIFKEIMTAIRPNAPNLPDNFSPLDAPYMMAWVILAKCAASESNKVIMAAAAKVIEQHIQENGKIHVKKAMDQSSGHIPKSLRPTSTSDYANESKAKAEKAAVLERAGTTVLRTGGITTVYHPKLTTEDLVDAKLMWKVPKDTVALPMYMVRRDGVSDENEKAVAAWSYL